MRLGGLARLWFTIALMVGVMVGIVLVARHVEDTALDEVTRGWLSVLAGWSVTTCLVISVTAPQRARG